HAMLQQAHRRERLAPHGEMVGRGAQRGGDEVVGVATELVMGQPDDEALNRARRKEQQERAADQLEEPVQPLEDHADFEGHVELGALVHPVSIAPARLSCATATAWSASTVMKAFSLGCSSSTFVRQSLTTSTGESRPARTCALVLARDGKVICHNSPAEGPLGYLSLKLLGT